MPYCRNMFLRTHILYADDIFICCAGTRKNIRCLLRVFNSYSEVSGQLVNFEKRKLFTGAMTSTRSRNLARLSGLSLGVIPFQYLGCPIFQGRPRRIHFQAIVDRIKVKLASWKISLLWAVLLVTWVRFQFLRPNLRPLLLPWNMLQASIGVTFGWRVIPL